MEEAKMSPCCELCVFGKCYITKCEPIREPLIFTGCNKKNLFMKGMDFPEHESCEDFRFSFCNAKRMISECLEDINEANDRVKKNEDLIAGLRAWIEFYEEEMTREDRTERIGADGLEVAENKKYDQVES